ncbi:hypothetical protein B9479_003000 [Cryptococcus floricola]|uniref:Nucleolar pre-ribosomal-associated protein 1 C-terminal domain-containing protein n=1 Tax=Cryptococcus floricola TaxID=2591691 RepID=A0A5D3B1H7_9TREE|nr:hypothetical protein B9479_003000 [Cryptococcus floricola]
MSGVKRKRADLQDAGIPAIIRPKAGTKAFASGKGVKDGLDTGSPQAFVSFRQQIVTPHSTLPLAITHPTVIILQHYLDVSPTCDEIFRAWQIGDQTKSEQQVHAAVELLSEIIQILTPIPFFRSSVLGLVNKIISQSDPYHDYINHLILSAKKDDAYHGLLLASAAMTVDPPTVLPSSSSSSGRIGMKLWSTLVEGGSVRNLGKQMGMRRRNKDGMVAYGEKDPLDKPDIRHLILRLISPLFSTSPFQPHARSLLPPLYSNLASDPPITIFRVLSSLWAAMTSQSGGFNRRVSLILFQERSIEALWNLLGNENVEKTSGKTVGELVYSFLIGITATPGKGVCFVDEGWYPRRAEGDKKDDERKESSNDAWRKGLHNRILGNVVRKVGTQVVDEDGIVGDWMIRVFEACPELVSGYWPHSALALDPRLNPRWTATMAYVGRLISLPSPPLQTFRVPAPAGTDPSLSPFRPEPPQISTVIESIVPSPLTRAHLMKGLQHTEGIVQYTTAVTLSRALSKLSQVLQLFSTIETELFGAHPSPANAWARGKRELEMEARKRIPELSVIIAFAQKSATMAPAEPETDEELALATKSTMLTESALRIFSLCNRALPSMSSELKFDVGRLLVSSSSTKQEKRDAREAREGSVISDSGSIKSAGTVGTAGMGGGFGTGRGDVRGFEALSQVHVLELLGEVRDWNWTNKAAGSQFTYLYHILLLHLSTPQPVTLSKTTSLLSHLLLPTLLFEHDPSELSIWLSAMPRGSRENYGPMLLVQQIHLLSFLDDCFRRCLKTPYRYIEEASKLIETSGWQSGNREMISPLVMAILEQLSAKIMGQLIATEAACIVVNYLRRVILGLAGKQGNLSFLDRIVARLDEIVEKAREAGQGRIGLAEVVQVIRRNLDVTRGKKGSEVPGDVPRLMDEPTWASKSFETQSLETFSSETLLPLIATSDNASAQRHATFLLHLNVFRSSKGNVPAALEVFEKLFEKVGGKEEVDMKKAVFGDKALRKLMLSDKGDEYRAAINALTEHLKLGKSTDEEIAQSFVEECLGMLKDDKKGKKAPEILSLLRPWTAFLSPSQATQATETVFGFKKPIAPSPSITPILSDIITGTQSPTFAIKHLHELGKLGVVSAVERLLKGAEKSKTGYAELLGLEISSETVKYLMSESTDETLSLLAELVKTVPSAAQAVQPALSGELKDKRLLLVVEALLDLDLQVEGVETIAQLALQSLAGKTKSLAASATQVLVLLSSTDSNAINNAIGQVELSSYTSAIASLTKQLAIELASTAELKPAVGHLIGLGLQYAVRVCSELGEIPAGTLTALVDIADAVSATDRDYFTIQQALVEPIITAVVQDRLDVDEAANLAVVLAGHVELKASFIRQQLQALYSTKAYTRSTTTSCPPTLRLNFVRLLHTLFAASTYTSCQPPFVEPLVLLYRGTMSEADRRILHMLQLFEGYRKISVASVMRFWSASGVLGIGGKSLDALTSLDPQKVFATCQAYPLRRTLRNWGKKSSNAEDGEDIYDPVFVTALFVASMSEKMHGLDWVEVLRGNAIGLVTCGLASRDKDVRSVSSFTLAKVMSLIEITPFLERTQLIYTMRLLRHALPSQTSRLPTLTTLFFAYAIRAIANPAHFLYPITTRFLLQRSVFDIEDTPMLYGMLYASGEFWKRERGWMMRFLKEGIRSEADWRVIRRRKVWTLLATMFTESLDPGFRRGVLQTMSNIALIPAATSSLVLRDGLLVWINMQWTTITTHFASLPASSKSGAKGQRAQAWEKEEKNLLVQMAEAAIKVMSSAEKQRLKEDGKSVRGWILQAEELVKNIIKGKSTFNADFERLRSLSSIASEIAQIPNNGVTTRLFHLLVKRLEPLEGPSTAIHVITANLFEIGLTFSVPDLKYDGSLREALSSVSWRVERGDGGSQLRDWVRRERRLEELSV